jgi:aspartate racemase
MSKVPQSKVLGVLGGMGPAATLDFLAKLQAATPVKREQDHLRVLVDINPKVPDRNVSTSDPGLEPFSFRWNHPKRSKGL